MRLPVTDAVPLWTSTPPPIFPSPWLWLMVLPRTVSAPAEVRTPPPWNALLSVMRSPDSVRSPTLWTPAPTPMVIPMKKGGAFPPRIVIPAIVTGTLSTTSKTRSRLSASTVVAAAPAPRIVIGVFMSRSPWRPLSSLPARAALKS